MTATAPAPWRACAAASARCPGAPCAYLILLLIGGQHIRVEGRYLDVYAAHAASLEDHRFDSNGALVDRLIGGALAASVSRAWKGYWQRRAA